MVAGRPLLAVVVVSLLRSHAEVLRRLPSPEEDEDHALGRQLVQVERSSVAAADPAAETTIPGFLPSPRGEVTAGHDIGGRTLQGDAVAISVTAGPPTLVAFLSSGCLTCRTFWEGLRPEVRQPLPAGARLVVVPASGHLSTLEQPVAVNTALVEWMAA